MCDLTHHVTGGVSDYRKAGHPVCRNVSQPTLVR
jgi:hypothetical protein